MSHESGDDGLMSHKSEHYPDVLVVNPKETDAERFVKENSRHNGADRVLEVAGSSDTFELAWKVARPNAIVTVVALYEENQTLPLPQMYGKNLIFKTGGVDGCDIETDRAGTYRHNAAYHTYISAGRNRTGI